MNRQEYLDAIVKVLKQCEYIWVSHIDYDPYVPDRPSLKILHSPTLDTGYIRICVTSTDSFYRYNGKGLSPPIHYTQAEKYLQLKAFW